MPNKPLVLIDGDIILYRCAFAAERTKYLVIKDRDIQTFDTHKEATAFAGTDWNVWSRKEVEPVSHALQAAKTTLDNIRSRHAGSRVDILLSDVISHREAVARTRPYKGNRTQPKPTHYEELKEYLLREHGATIGPRQEADDAIGIAATAAYPDVVIYSIDKDLGQIAGWHGALFGGDAEAGLRWVSKREGDFQLYSQILSGDSTDNVPGIEGLGPKRAGNILEGSKSTKELCERTWATYNDRSYAFSYFREQADLVYILRDRAGPDRDGYYFIPPEGAIKL